MVFLNLKWNTLSITTTQIWKLLKRNLTKVVELIINERPQFSIGLLTPNQIHNDKNISPQNLWKKQPVNLF